MGKIVINQNNLVQDGNNNTFVYNFPNTVSFPHHEIAVQSVSMYYSWNNININLNNNTFTIYFPVNTDGAQSTGNLGLTTFIITIPVGHYEIADLNLILQKFCLANGLYLINPSGVNVFFMEFILNPTSYAVQINITSFPNNTYWNVLSGSGSTTIAIGNVAPFVNWLSPPLLNGFGIFKGFPPITGTANSFNPIVFLPSKFCYLLGYLPNTYTYGGIGNGTISLIQPTPINTYNTLTISTTSYLSSIAPEVQPNSSIYFSLSNIQNIYAVPSSIIYSIAPTVAYGSQIVNFPPQFAYNKLMPGSYTQLRLTILDLNYQPLQIKDPNTTITLVIRDTKEI